MNQSNGVELDWNEGRKEKEGKKEEEGDDAYMYFDMLVNSPSLCDTYLAPGEDQSKAFPFPRKEKKKRNPTPQATPSHPILSQAPTEVIKAFPSLSGT